MDFLIFENSFHFSFRPTAIYSTIYRDREVSHEDNEVKHSNEQRDDQYIPIIINNHRYHNWTALFRSK